MATKHGINAGLYMGPNSGVAVPITETTEITIEIDTDFASDAAQGDSWDTSLPGLSTFSLTFTKHYDSAAGGQTLLQAVRDRTLQKFYAYPDRSDNTVYVYGTGYLGGGGLNMGMGDVIDQEFSLEPSSQPTIVAP